VVSVDFAVFKFINILSIRLTFADKKVGILSTNRLFLSTFINRIDIFSVVKVQHSL